MVDDQGFTAALDRVWAGVLAQIIDGDWTRAEQELQRRIEVARRLPSPPSHAASPNLEPELIVLASIQQKFGELKAARETLRNIGPLPDDARLIAQVVESRVLSQSGHFKAAHDANLRLVSLVGESAGRDTRPDSRLLESMPSLAWRLAMTAGMTGDTKLSDYWFKAHRDASITTHASQLANNDVFSSVVSLATGNGTVRDVHESNVHAIEAFLQDGLSTSTVLFLSLAKSIAVPLVLEAVLLLRYGQKYDGLVQALLARHLLEYSRIQPRSEGVAELVGALAGSDGSLAIEIIRRSSMAPAAFLDWLVDSTADTKLVSLAVGEAEERFREFQRLRQYKLLFIVGDTFPSVTRGQAGRTACFFWGGKDHAGWHIRAFLVEDLGLRVLGFGARESTGLDRLKVLDSCLKQASAAVVHLHPSLHIELGASLQRWEPKRVIYLSTGREDADLGLSSLKIDEASPASAFFRIRRALDVAFTT